MKARMNPYMKAAARSSSKAMRMNAATKATMVVPNAMVAFFAVEGPGGILPCNTRPGIWPGCGVTINRNNWSVDLKVFQTVTGRSGD